jgi:hypothetical protein
VRVGAAEREDAARGGVGVGRGAKEGRLTGWGTQGAVKKTGRVSAGGGHAGRGGEDAEGRREGLRGAERGGWKSVGGPGT